MRDLTVTPSIVYLEEVRKKFKKFVISVGRANPAQVQD